ncbi:uncharacterized protein [Magallana gigas]|uniref:uncharacterized protein n=1 Tax=Magallana gigas TaxID=29159 RepID=UPI003340F57D
MNANWRQKLTTVMEMSAAKKRKPPEINRRVLPGGVLIEDLRPGYGSKAEEGDKVCICKKTLRQTGEKKSFRRIIKIEKISFIIGKREVCRKMESGVKGMKQGGKRKLVIPRKR